MIDVALLGRLEACLDVENLLLDEERGRDERRSRLWIDVGEGFVVWRPGVCQVSGIQIDDDETEIVDGSDGVMLVNHLVDGDGWE